MTKRLIIVLGYTLNNDGSIQPVLQSRLDEAKSIYQPTDTILVCGKYPPKDVVPTRCEHPTEAEAMKQYLILQGIPAEYILKEEDSVTTFGNALFRFLKIRNEINQYHSIVVVSNEFHGPLVEYSFNTVFGAHLYTFHASPDVISVEAL